MTVTRNKQKSVGYLVPEFPAQTHIFFWREVSALRKLGITVHLISTRKPHASKVSHSWAEAAMRETEYLYPLGPMGLARAAREFVRAGLGSSFGLFRCILAKSDLTWRARFGLLILLPYAIQLVAMSRDKDWTHLHVGSCGRSAELAWIACALSSLTYSISMLGPTFATYGGNQKMKWGRASFGLFQSEKLLAEGHETLGEYMPQRVAFAPVGVDVSVMKRAAPYQSWNPGEVCKLYSCGRLNPIKGHNFVIQALALLRTEGIDAHLVIAGEDDNAGNGYRRELEALIRELKLNVHVELIGAVSEEVNRAYMDNAHIYVMGSLDEAAGAVAAMEAMSMEVPVVMPAVGATAELIENNQEGLLVKPKSPQQLNDAVLRLLRDPDFAQQIGRFGRAKIVEKFSHEISARKMVEFLADM